MSSSHTFNAFSVFANTLSWTRDHFCHCRGSTNTCVSFSFLLLYCSNAQCILTSQPTLARCVPLPKRPKIFILLSRHSTLPSLLAFEGLLCSLHCFLGFIFFTETKRAPNTSSSNSECWRETENLWNGRRLQAGHAYLSHHSHGLIVLSIQQIQV